MATYTPTIKLGHLLLVEVAPGWTKEKGVLLAGTAYAFGQVLAKVAGKYQVLDPAGEGAAAQAAGVLGEAVDARDADAVGVVIARGAALDLAELTWPAGITDLQKAAALEQLDARGIVARATL